jgi:hypothetical protein
MTPDEAVRAMIARLGAIDWTRHGDKSWSKAVLLKEYFRRAARWARAYGCAEGTPFFDIAACVDPNVRADQIALDSLPRNVATPARTVDRINQYILHWAALRATLGEDLPAGLDDPFEPLILLFERGGGLHTENGEVNLELKSVRMAGWLNRADDAPLAGFAAEDLDEVDRAGSIAQFGYMVDPL